MLDCDDALAVSTRIATWQRRQPNVGEESLTDWLLFELSERSDRVGYRKFSRAEEGARSGADWEWWFVGETQSVAVRVQAKRIHSGRSNYASFTYPRGSKTQIAKLRSAAAASGMAALYAFYASGVAAGATACCKRRAAAGGDGVFIADANTVFAQCVAPGPRRIEASELLRITVPLSCFFCCSLEKASVDRVYSFFKDRFPVTFAQGPGHAPSRKRREERVSLFTTVPEYVLATLSSDQESVVEFKRVSVPDNIRAVLAVDLRRP